MLEIIKAHKLLTGIVYRIPTGVKVFSRISKRQMFSLTATKRSILRKYRIRFSATVLLVS